MSDSTIASISIPVRVDFSDLKRDLNSLQSFALPKIDLKPSVDHRELTKLNQHLDLKERHYKQLANYFQNNPLKPKVDTSEIRRATKEIQDFQGLLKRGSYDLPTIRQKVELEIDGKAIEEVFRKSASGINLGNIFGNIVNAPFRLVAEAGKQIFIGAFQSVGAPLGKELGKGLRDGIERELSFSVGSMGLIGRKMGQALSSEIADVMTEELGLVGQIMQDLMGKAETTREGAAVRNRQRQQQSQSTNLGSEQLYREYDFFKQNATELRARTADLDRRQKSADLLDRQIQQKIAKTAEVLGLSKLQQQIKDNDTQRTKYSERLKAPDASSEETRLISLQLQRLSTQDRNTISRIDEITKLAESKHRTDLDRIATIKERLMAEEKQLLQVIDAPDRLQFATKRQQPIKQEPDLRSLPDSYLSVVKQVSELTGTRVRDSQIPKLYADPALSGVKQNYNPQKNAVAVSQEVYDQLSSGTASKKAIENLVHELVHAIQFKFGQITDVAKAGRANQIVPNADEARKLGANIERSTNAGEASEAIYRRALEADAYTFAYRNQDKIYEQVVRQNRQSQLENALGVGGGKASLEITREAMQGFNRLQKFSSIAPVDVTFGLQESVGRIEQIRAQVLAGLAKLDNVDLLGTDEIEKIQNEILLSVKRGASEIQAVTEEFKQRLISNPDSLTKPLEVPLDLREQERVLIGRVQRPMQAQSNSRRVDPKATENLTAISEAITRGSLEQNAIDKVKATSDYFVQAYKRLKESIAKGGKQAQKDLDLFVRSVESAQKEIDSIVTGLKSEGVDVNFAKSLGGKLQGLKGQLSSKRNTANRLANRSNLGQDSGDDQSLYAFEDIQVMFDKMLNALLGRKRVDPDVLMFRTQYNQKAYDEAETGIEHQYNSSYQQVNASLESMGQAAETTTARVKRIIRSNLNPETTFGGFIEGIKNASMALAGFGAAGLVLGVLTNLARETSKAALEMDSLGRRFKNIEGSSDAGKSKLEELRESSDALGVSFRESAQAYAQFASVTKGTSLEGFQTTEIVKAIQVAGAANGLSNERQRLVNTGFSQLLSKGKVSQEEIRQQIGESLPGFIQTASRAYGVSVPELNRMISGGMDSNRFAVKVTQQMQAELAGGANDAARSPQASLNRFSNAQEELTARAGQRFLPATAMGAEVAAKAMNTLADNIDRLLQLLATVATTAATFGFQGLIANSGLLGSAIAFVSTQVKALVANMGGLLPILGRFLLITAAIEVFKVLQTALSDSGGQFREFADASEKALNKYEQALANASGKQADFVSKLPRFQDQIKGKSYLEDSIFGFVGKDNARFIEDKVLGIGQKIVRDKQGNVVYDSKAGAGMLNPFNYIPNRAQDENKDQIKAMDEHLSRMDKVSSKVQDQLSGRKTELQQLVAIDKQIEEIQAKRRAIASTSADPGVKDPQLDQLKNQEEQLNKRRVDMLAPIAALQQNAAQEVENAQKALDGLQQKVEDGTITQDQYNQKQAQYSDRLKTAKANQEALNASLRDSLSKLSAFEKAWQKIADLSIDAQKQIEIKGSLDTSQVYQNELAGGQTKGATDSQLQQIQREIAAQQQNKKQQELIQKAAELNAQNAAEVFRNFGVTSDTRQSQLKTLAENATGEREKKILQSYSEYLTLKDSIVQGEQQINQQKVESARQIREVGKSVEEFFRNIQRSSEGLALDLKSMDLETKLLGMRTKVKGAFTGFYSTFMDEFADGIISIFEMMNEQTKNQIEAARSIQQRMQGLDDTLRQSNELGQTLPNGMSVGGGQTGSTTGNAFRSGLYTGDSSTNGGSAAYHIDTKFHKSMSENERLQMMDAMARAYAAEGRKIEFSNNAVAGSVWNPDDPNRLDLLRRAQSAHSHSRYAEWESVDYYIPKRNEDRFGKSAENAQILLPQVAGGKVEYGTGGGYGNYALIYNSRGELIAKTGHGDNSKALPQSMSFGNIAQSNAPSQVASGSGGFSNTFGFSSARANEALQFYLSKGISAKGAAYIVGNYMQESSLDPNADNGTHRGLGQWSRDRIRDAGGNLPNTFQGQLAFSMKDLAVDSPNSLAILKNPNATDAQIRQAISGWMRYGSGEEQSRFKYGAGLASQLAGRPIAPTTGMTQGSLEANQQLQNLSSGWNSQIQQGNQIAIADAEKANAATMQRLEAQNKLSKVQLEDLRKKNIQRARQGVLDSERGVIDQERKLADIRNNLGDSTPERELRNQLTGVERNRQDALKDINPQYEKLTQSLEHSKALLQIIGKLPGFEDQAKVLRESIPTLERQQRHLGEVKKQINDTYGAQATDLIEKFNQAQREARIQVAAQIQQTEVELRQKQNESLRLNVRGAYQQSQFDYVSGANALPSAIANERATLDQKLLDLEKQKREGKLTADEFDRLEANYIAISKVNLANTIQQVQKLKEASETARETFNFNQYQQVYDSQVKLGNARKSSYGLYGLQTQQNFFDEVMGREGIEFDYQNQVRQLNNLMQAGDLASGTALELKQNLDEIRGIQLDNLEKQFDPMTKAIGDTRNAFQGFLMDLFNGQKGFMASVGDFFKNIATNLFSQFAQYATDEIFGGFLKRNTDAAKKDSGGIFGTLGVFKDRTNTEEMFPLLVQQSGQQFLQFSIDAANEIRNAGYEFAATMRAEQSLNQTFLGSADYGFASASQQMNPWDVPEKAMQSTYSFFDNPAVSFSDTIVEGASMASSILSNSGTKASDNLLGNLSNNLPGILGNIVGLFGGKGKGGTSNIIGSVVGIASKLFGFADGGIIPGIRSKADDQLILAQKGEAVLTHRGVDLLGSDRINLINKGRLPKFAEGGIVGRGSLGLAVVPEVSDRGFYRQANVQSTAAPIANNSVVNVTINQDGSSTVESSKGDLLGAKLSNAVKAILISESKPGGILRRG